METTGQARTVDTEALLALLKEHLSMLLDIPSADIESDVSFADLGVDSMMRLELVALVEQHIRRELSEQELERMRTLSDVVDHVRSSH